MPEKTDITSVIKPGEFFILGHEYALTSTLFGYQMDEQNTLIFERNGDRNFAKTSNIVHYDQFAWGVQTVYKINKLSIEDAFERTDHALNDAKERVARIMFPAAAKAEALLGVYALEHIASTLKNDPSSIGEAYPAIKSDHFAVRPPYMNDIYVITDTDMINQDLQKIFIEKNMSYANEYEVIPILKDHEIGRTIIDLFKNNSNRYTLLPLEKVDSTILQYLM